MFKRILYFALALLFIVSLFMLSGCQKGSEPVVNDNVQEITDEVEEVSFGVWDIYEPQSEASKLIYNHIKENFKIDLKPITLSKDDWKSQIDWMVGANQLPDVFVHDVMENKFQYAQLINTGAIAPLPKEVWGQMDRLSAVLSWYEGIYAVEGNMYFLPRTYQTFDQTHGTTNVIYYRSDWAKKLTNISFSESAKLVDIIKVLESYRASDPDGNTVWDTWGITGAGGIDFLWSAFLEPFGVREWMYEDGSWKPGLISNKAKEAMAWAAQLYRDGIIDPDVATQTSEFAMKKFLSGRAGMVIFPAYHQNIAKFEKDWKEYNPDKDLSKSVKILPSYTTPTGTIYNEVETFDGGTLVSSRVSDNKMKKILSLFNWMYTGEGRNFLEKGDNAPLSINDGEEIQTFDDKNTELRNMKNLASWNLDKNPVDNVPDTSYGTYVKDMVENNIWPWSHESELFTNGMVTPEMCIFDIDQIAQDKLFSIIKTTRDFDADWDSYVKSIYNELNVQAAIDEVNAKWAESQLKE